MYLAPLKSQLLLREVLVDVPADPRDGFFGGVDVGRSLREAAYAVLLPRLEDRDDPHVVPDTRQAPCLPIHLHALSGEVFWYPVLSRLALLHGGEDRFAAYPPCCLPLDY